MKRQNALAGTASLAIVLALSCQNPGATAFSAPNPMASSAASQIPLSEFAPSSLANASSPLPGDYQRFSNKSSEWWNVSKDLKADKTRLDLIQKYGGYAIDRSLPAKTIYLTFDCGYENGYTSKILDVLSANNVQVTFFVTSRYLDKQKPLVRRMAREGHYIGNHTANHKILPEVSKDTFIREIMDLDAELNDMGIHTKYLRPPNGAYSERSLAMTHDLGYKSVFWTFAYKDYDDDDQKGTRYAHDKVMGGLRDGSIILLHASSKDNANALDSIIKDAKARGYQFARLSSLK